MIELSDMNHFTLFLDESGKSSLTAKTNEPFILTGVILNDEEINTIAGFFEYIKRRFGFDLNEPFHSYETFEKLESRLSVQKGKLLVKTLADFLSLIPIRIYIVSIDKSDFKKSLGVSSNNDLKGSRERNEIKQFPYQIMSAYLYKWFASCIRKKDNIGQIITDSRRGADYQLITSLSWAKDPNGPLPLQSQKLIQDKCNAICFADKSFLSGGLEIADLISFVSFFNARSNMNSMDHIRLNLIWKEVKNKLRRKKIHRLSNSEIRQFFKIPVNEVYKYLK